MRCSIAKRRVSSIIQATLHSPREWAHRVSSEPKAKRTNHVGRLCCSRAPGLSSREQRWIAPVLLAAVQPSPWLRPATCNSPQTRPTNKPRQGHRTPKNKTNEFKRENPQTKHCAGRAGCRSGEGVSTPGLSHLSWLSTSPAAIEANQNSQTRTQTGQKKQEKPSIRAIKLRHSCLSGKRNTRPIRTGESHIHHAGSSKREKAPGRAAEDRSGESSTGRGGGQMQL